MATDKWLSTTGGDFSNAADWSTGAVPGPTTDALLTTAGTYTVTSSASETVNSLQMVQGITLAINGGTFQMTNGSGSGTDNGLIQINGNNTLVVGGTLAGTGTVQLNTNGYNADFVLNTATTTLSGGGQIVMSDSSANRIYAAAAGNVLNNVSDTISGGGQIGLDQTGLDNQSGGVIDGTGTGTTMILDFGTFSALNAGLIEATGAAGLQIQNSTITNTGTIKAVGHDVYLSNATVVGGTLVTTGAGQIVSANTATLNGVTIATASTVALNNNVTLDLLNTIVNKGTIALNTNGYNTDLIAASAITTLTGGGKVQLTDSGANRIYGATGTTKLVNVNNTISGSGQIGAGQLVIDNQVGGVIDATGVGTGLTIQTTGFTNEGLIEDTGTAGLGINGSTITNKGTILAAGTNTSVNLYGGTDIVGGKLATSGGGLIETVNGETAMLDGSTATGAVTITAGSTVAIQNNSTLNIAGSIVNLGTIAINTDGYTDELVVSGTIATLTGVGHVTLSDTGANYIVAAAATDKLVNVNNIISGSGQIGVGSLTLDNQAAGVIDATGANAGLTLDASAFTNEGVVEATGPGGLGIDNTTIVNTGTIGAFGTGATTNLYNGAIIEGGTLATSGGGYLFTGNTSTLDGSTNGVITLATGSTFEINGNNTLDLVGTLVNDGTLQMNADGYDNDLIINSATVTLTGGGTIAMNDVGSNRIYGAVATNLLVNVNDTITGSGQIGANQGSFDNQAQGVIDATGTNAGLTIFAQSFTNEGLIEDTGKAGLGIQSTTIVNSGTLLSNGTGSTVNLYNGATVEGGTLLGVNGGVFETTNTGTLDGATHGSLTLAAGSIFDVNGNVTLDLVGTIVNHGTIAMNADGYDNDLVANSATVTLTGGGAIAMDDVGSNRIYGALSTDVFANVNNTISGSGQIGSGQGTIDNQAAGVIDSTGVNGITLNATFFTNEGLIEATHSGGVTIQTSIVNSGTIAAYGAGDAVNLDNGAAIEGGTLAGSGGGFFETTNSGTLDGTTNGAVTIANGASFEINGNVTLYVGGSIVNEGTIAMNTDGYNDDLVINTPTVTLSGGGSVVLSDAGANRIYGAVTTDKLVNASDTISGSGQLGAGQLTLDNQRLGVIDATGTGTNLDIYLNSTFTNEGLVEASGPAGLLIQSATLTNTGTIASLTDSTLTINSSATLTNDIAGTLTGGTYEAISSGGTHTSTLSIASAPVVVDAAHLVISGVGATILFDGTSALSTLTTIAAGGELDIQNGATFAASNTLTNGGTILLSGSLSAPAITNTVRGVISANGGTATLSTTGKLTSSGTLQATSGGVLVLVGGTLSSSGLVIAQAGGTVDITSAEHNSNLVAGKLSRGTWSANGAGATLLLAGGVITNDSATIDLSGTGSVIKSGPLGKTLESTLATISAASQLNVLNGRGFASTATAGIADSGTIALGGATFSDVSLNIAAGGSFLGGGTLAGAVTDNGSIIASASPAGSNGTLTLTGAASGSGLLSAGAATTLVASGYAVGTITVAAGGTLTGAGSASGAVTVAGDLLLGATGTLSAGSVSIAAGGTLSGASVVSAGTVADSGTLLLSGGTLAGSAIGVTGLTAHLAGSGTVTGAITSTGTIEASGGTLTLAAGESGGTLLADAGGTLASTAIAASKLTIAAGGAFVGAGSVSGLTSDSGTLTASGGALTLASDIGTGAAVIANSATLDSTSGLRLTGGVSFTTGGTGEVLALGTPAGDTAKIAGFGNGTTIDLLNTTVTSFGYAPASGTMTLKDGTTTLGTLKFAGSYTAASFALSSDGHGGTDITYTGAAAPSPLVDLQSAIAATSSTPDTVIASSAAPSTAWQAPAVLFGAGFDPALSHPSAADLTSVHLSVQ